MSVLRQFAYQGQQRWDLPHARSIESSICADFDVLAGMMMAGTKPLVVRGFDIINSDLAIGQKPQDLQLNASQGLMMHYYATEAGSIFYNTDVIVDLNETDSRFQGSFTANSVNYVGIDLYRTSNTDPTTDTVKFLNPDTETEISRQIPLGALLDFKVVVTTQDFDSLPSLCPICKITTDASNNVTAIEDCRYTPFRLARGGSYPNIYDAYTWPQGRDEEDAVDLFSGGDKAIWSYKDWADAVMTRLWELGGGKFWYSPTADRNVRLTRTGTTFSNGEWFEWDGTNLHWRGLRIVFDNSGTTIWYNTISDQLVDSVNTYGYTATNLADGDCLYVDIDRTTNATVAAVKGITAQLGWPTTPGSRIILAWRVGTQVFTRDSAFQVGATFTAATVGAMGIVKLSHAATTPASPIVYSDGAANVANGVITLNASKQASYTSAANTAPALSVTGFDSATGILGTGGANSGAGVSGVGGAVNGNGLLGTGQNTGSGAVLTSGGAGQAIRLVQVTSNTNVAPILSVVDSAGNMRNMLDHVGYMTGRYNEFHENWIVSGTPTVAAPITTLPAWSAFTDSTGTIARVAPTASYPATMMELTASLAVADHINLYSSCSVMHSGFLGLCYVMEWEAAVSASPVSDKTLFMGLSNSPAGSDPSSASYIGFWLDGSVSSWETKTVNGGLATIGAGAAFAANEIIRFRMEIYGSSTVHGSTKVFFYMNGVLQNGGAPHTTNIPSEALSMVFANVTGNLAVTETLKIGPVKAYWNRYLNLSTL